MLSPQLGVEKNQDNSDENGFLGTCCTRLEGIFVEILSPAECGYHQF